MWRQAQTEMSFIDNLNPRCSCFYFEELPSSVTNLWNHPSFPWQRWLNAKATSGLTFVIVPEWHLCVVQQVWTSWLLMWWNSCFMYSHFMFFSRRCCTALAPVAQLVPSFPGCGGSLRRLSDVIQCWSEKMMTTSPPAELRSPALSRSSSFWSHSDEGRFLWPPSEVLQLLLLLASSSRNVSLHLQSNSEDINKYEEALCHYAVKKNTFATSKCASC